LITEYTYIVRDESNILFRFVYWMKKPTKTTPEPQMQFIAKHS